LDCGFTVAANSVERNKMYSHVSKSEFWKSEPKEGKRFLKELAETFKPITVNAYSGREEHKHFTVYRCYWSQK